MRKWPFFHKRFSDYQKKRGILCLANDILGLNFEDERRIFGNRRIVFVNFRKVFVHFWVWAQWFHSSWWKSHAFASEKIGRYAIVRERSCCYDRKELCGLDEISIDWGMSTLRSLFGGKNKLLQAIWSYLKSKLSYGLTSNLKTEFRTANRCLTFAYCRLADVHSCYPE